MYGTTHKVKSNGARGYMYRSPTKKKEVNINREQEKNGKLRKSVGRKDARKKKKKKSHSSKHHNQRTAVPTA